MRVLIRGVKLFIPDNNLRVCFDIIRHKAYSRRLLSSTSQRFHKFDDFRNTALLLDKADPLASAKCKFIIPSRSDITESKFVRLLLLCLPALTD